MKKVYDEGRGVDGRMKVIDMQDVSLRRDGETILSHVNWQVEKGEHWTIVGMNGSGKTTLLNMINGYIWPTTGNIHVLRQTFGKTDIRKLRKSIGWVSSSLQEKITGIEIAENVIVSGKYASIGLYERPTDADFERAVELMQQFELEHLKGRTYQTCSQGEKQKLLIARGLMNAPELLILDEPTSGLDFLAREELLAFIEELARQKDAPTIIFVTHHTEEILPVFGHTLLIQQGKIFKQGKTRDVLTENVLSDFLQLPIKVEWMRNRAWMMMR